MSSETLIDCIITYLRESSALRSLAALTVNSYHYRLKTFVDFCASLGIDNISELHRDVAIDYFYYLDGQGWASTTIYGKKLILRSFWNWAYNRNLLGVSLDIRINRPPEPQTVYLEPPEIRRLRQVAKVGTKRFSILHLRDQAAFVLLDETGIRVSVLLRLQIGDYDRDRRALKIESINALLNENACKLLDEYLTTREARAGRNLRKTEPLFASFTGRKWSHKYVRQAVNRHRQCIGLPSLQPGEYTYPQDWPSEEQQLFVQIPVHPYDRSIINSKLILGLGLHCGLRAGEMIGIEIGHIDWHQSRLYVNGETAKGHKSRYVPLNDSMVGLLEPHRSSRTSNGHLLVRGNGLPLTYKCVNRIVKKLAHNAGITYKDVTPHTLRHTFATNLKNQGISIHTISKLLGHSSIAETERYLHTGEREMEAAVEKLVEF